MPESRVRVLVVEDNALESAAIKDQLVELGFDVFTAANQAEALHSLLTDLPSVVVLDYNLRGDETGRDVLSKIREIDGNIPVLINSAALQEDVRGEKARDVRADLVRGAADFILEKGGPPDELPLLIGRLAGSHRDVVSAIEDWVVTANPPDTAALVVGDKTFTMRQALAEMRKGSPVGRELIKVYVSGLAQVLSAGSGTS